MSDQYFVLGDDNQSMGPFPESEIRRRLAVGEMTGREMIAQEGWSKWERANSMFPIPVPPPVPKPAPPAGPLVGAVKLPPEKYQVVARNVSVCRACGALAKSKMRTKGSLAVEIALWCLFCAPGLIYSIWRMTSRERVCGDCFQPGLIKAGSHEGRAYLATRGIRVG